MEESGAAPPAMSGMTSSETAIESVSRPFSLRPRRPPVVCLALSLGPAIFASFFSLHAAVAFWSSYASTLATQADFGLAGALAGSPLSDMERAAGRGVSSGGRANERTRDPSIQASIPPSPPRPLLRPASSPRLRRASLSTPFRPSSSFFRWCGALSLGSAMTKMSSKKKMRQCVKGKNAEARRVTSLEG